MKQKIRNDSLQQDNNGNVVSLVKFAIPKNLVFKRSMFPRTETFISTSRPPLMGRLTTLLNAYG